MTSNEGYSPELPIYDTLQIMGTHHNIPLWGNVSENNLINDALLPPYLRLERQRAQARHIAHVSNDTTQILKLFDDRKIPRPSAYGVFTAGFDVPEDSILLGKCEEGVFTRFPLPDLLGHPGNIYAVDLDGYTMMIIKGRAHPAEWFGERFASMVVAHPLRVVQELIRRQRAELGIDPFVFLSYLTGVAEGVPESNPMQPGDLGVLVDDAELTNALHPGQGSVELLSEYIGPHHQSKMRRTSDEELAKLFIDQAEHHGANVYPAVTCGTPGTPEFQSVFDAELVLTAFQGIKRNPIMENIVSTIVGENGISRLAQLWSMGITFELATLRQTFRDEADYRVLAATLPTDLVGGQQSLTIAHNEVFAKAMETSPRNSALVFDVARAAIKSSSFNIEPGQPDFSIFHRLEELKTS